MGIDYTTGEKGNLTEQENAYLQAVPDVISKGIHFTITDLLPRIAKLHGETPSTPRPEVLISGVYIGLLNCLSENSYSDPQEVHKKLNKVLGDIMRNSVFCNSKEEAEEFQKRRKKEIEDAKNGDNVVKFKGGA